MIHETLARIQWLSQEPALDVVEAYRVMIRSIALRRGGKNMSGGRGNLDLEGQLRAQVAVNLYRNLPIGAANRNMVALLADDKPSAVRLADDGQA